MNLNLVVRFKKLEGNISILIIFVLLASSIIGLLSMGFIRQMVSYTNSVYSYHKSFYYAKAGLELALTEISVAGIGFSNHILSGDSVFLDNFNCFNCSSELIIDGKAQYLSDKFWMGSGCTDDNAFVLNGGESMILPMFSQRPLKDNFSLFNESIEYDTDILKYKDHLRFVGNQDFNGKFSLGLVVLLSGEIQKNLLFMKSLDGDEDMFVKYFKEYEDYYGKGILDKKDYLVYIIISNISDVEASFCIYMEDINSGGIRKVVKLPTTKFFISSFGNFLDKTVGLQAIYGQPVPNFFVNPYGR